MTDPITLPADTARELVYAGPGGALDGWTVADVTDDDTGRWVSYHRLVIRDAEGRHYAAGFESGLTEYQDTAPFEYDKQVEFRPVFADVRTVQVTEWSDNPPAPAAELTEAQRLAEQVIRIRARTHDGNASAAVTAKGLPRDQFRALLDEVRDLITRATVTVTWQDGEQAEGAK